jgi:Spy/CpxP family protein refolding chaperone
MGIVCISFAQNRQKLTPDEKAKRQTEQMKEKLNLTVEQEKQVYDINLKHIQKSEEEQKAHIERQKQRSSEIEAILTPEQQKTLAGNRSAMKEKHKNLYKNKEGKQKHKKRKKEKSKLTF